MGVGFWPNNTDKVNFNRPQDVGTRYAYGENRIRYSAEDFSVTNVIGYINSNEFLMGDIDGSSIDFFYEQESIKRDALSEELRIQSNPGKMKSIGPRDCFFSRSGTHPPVHLCRGAGTRFSRVVGRARRSHPPIRTPMRRVMRDLRKLSGTLPRPWRLLSAVDTPTSRCLSLRTTRRQE